MVATGSQATPALIMASRLLLAATAAIATDTSTIQRVSWCTHVGVAASTRSSVRGITRARHFELICICGCSEECLEVLVALER